MKAIYLGIAILFFTGCDMAAIKQDFVNRTCNKEGAYQKGYNDGNQNNDMNNSWSGQCPPETQGVVMQAYREGYVAARANRPTQINIGIGGIGGNGPGWECKEAYGKKTCGYDCKESYGQIKCAKFAGHNCLDSYGKIKCGLNCREEYGKVECDEYE